MLNGVWLSSYCSSWNRVDKRLGSPPQGNQEPLVVKDTVRRSLVSLGWASPWNVILLYVLTLLVGWQEWHPAHKKLGVVWQWWHSVQSFARLIAPVVTTVSIVLCPNKNPEWRHFGTGLSRLSWKVALSECHRVSLCSDWKMWISLEFHGPKMMGNWENCWCMFSLLWSTL